MSVQETRPRIIPFTGVNSRDGFRSLRHSECPPPLNGHASGSDKERLLLLQQFYEKYGGLGEIAFAYRNYEVRGGEAVHFKGGEIDLDTTLTMYSELLIRFLRPLKEDQKAGACREFLKDLEEVALPHLNNKITR